jgi:hypothetical protein
MKRRAFLPGWDVAMNRKRQPDFGSGNASKIPCECLTGGGEVFAGQVHLEVNRPQPSDSGLVIEPEIAGRHDIMTVVVPSAKSNTLGLDLEAVRAKQFPQGDVAHAFGRAVVAWLVLCHPLVLVHGCHDVPGQTGLWPQFGATLSRL